MLRSCGSRNHESTSQRSGRPTPYTTRSAKTSTGNASACRIGAADEPTTTNATSHARNRRVDLAGLGTLLTGSPQASAVTARIERRSTDVWYMSTNSVTMSAETIAQPRVPSAASATELAMNPVSPASSTRSAMLVLLWSATSARTRMSASAKGSSQMKMRYASAAPRTLPPMDESRRSVRHPTSATGSKGPHVVTRWASSSPRARARPTRVSSTGWFDSSASCAARELVSCSVDTTSGG